MASIGHDRNGRRRILFIGQDGSRKQIRLGKVTAKQADAFKIRLEALIGGLFAGIDDETARWVAGLPDDMHAKLAAVGLVKPRARAVGMTVGAFTEKYVKVRDDVKASTAITYIQARRHLLAFFGPDKPLAEIQRATRSFGGYSWFATASRRPRSTSFPGLPSNSSKWPSSES